MLERFFSFGKTREKQSFETTDKYRTITEKLMKLHLNPLCAIFKF